MRRCWPHVERKYVFRRRRLLKLRSAVADDAGLTSKSLTRLSTCGNIARIAGVMFLKTLVHTFKFGDVGLRAISGKEWNKCPFASGMIDHQMSTPGTDERPFR